MYVKLFTSLFIFFLCMTSCKKKHEAAAIPKAMGAINSVSVLIDDQLWNGEIGESIRNSFASPVLGLPKEEPLFTINQYPDKLMEGFMTYNRTIIIVKKENKTQFSIKKNEFATPQYVFHISGKNNADILQIIEEYAPKIIQLIKKSEIKESQRLHTLSAITTTPIQERFRIDLEIPKGYKYCLQQQKFIWLKKEIISGNTSILIYEIPLQSFLNSPNTIEKILKTRDSIGALYIKGTEINTPMRTEEGYSPYFFKTIIKGYDSFETKGTWELKNDFMSGPFINYAIIDKQHQRVLFLEGFCYSPATEERDLMHELEAIIKSIHIASKN